MTIATFLITFFIVSFLMSVERITPFVWPMRFFDWAESKWSKRS
jgi:hypothetical protein